ncbi:hypothetical protein [Serratia fonticola]|uniref:Uncharacterized protein n=1 Tax=Serratia fonticola TaxID=47917 RepID=A0ABY9PQQ0_SERFO|nr:hypothetical protein [Serratia fonticola]WMT14446.1 hypothetical protein RFB13_25220 [Serratia fonticola]HEJ9056771.1 hypothetical protein [Serratia fonticola]
MGNKNIVIISPYAYMAAAVEAMLEREGVHYRLTPLLIPMIYPQSPLFQAGWLKPDTVVLHVTKGVTNSACRTLDSFYATCSPEWRTLILFDTETAYQLSTLPCVCQQADAILSSATPLSILASILLKQDSFLPSPQKNLRNFSRETRPGANTLRWRA